MRVLYIISTLDPSYGGPVEGVKNVTNALCNLNIHVDILTLDNSLYNKNLYKARIYNPGFSIFKYGLNLSIFFWLFKRRNIYDEVIVNGVWQFHTLISRLALKKNSYYLYTHGMLDPWFQERYKFKHIKKLIYWFLFERKNLVNSKSVLFTTKKEYQLALKSFPFFKCRPYVTGFGLNGLKKIKSINIKKFSYIFSQKKTIFLHFGRVDPKKGTDILLEAVNKIFNKRADFALIIAGPDNFRWSQNLKKKYSNLINKKLVYWLGKVTDDEKVFLFKKSNFFILPSHSENFGAVIPEALSVGVPVITTEKVNIYNIIKLMNSGFICQDKCRSLVSTINKSLNLKVSDYKDLKINAFNCFEIYFSMDNYIKKLLNLFKDSR